MPLDMNGSNSTVPVKVAARRASKKYTVYGDHLPDVQRRRTLAQNAPKLTRAKVTQQESVLPIVKQLEPCLVTTEYKRLPTVKFPHLLTEFKGPKSKSRSHKKQLTGKDTRYIGL